MKFAIFALIACAGVAMALPKFMQKGQSLYEKEGHLHDMRIRLGHFKEQPFIDLYKQYATAFVYPLHKHEYAKDDYRNYMPSGAECMAYFRTLRGHQYEVKDFNDFIKLDACLGYLYDSDNHDMDTETSAIEKQQIATLKQDQNLDNLYSHTKINELSDDAKGCVADLLLSNVLARYQYPDVTCNNHFMQMYLQFAECQQGVISAEQREQDSYLKLIYQILKQQVHTCFDVEIDFMNQALRKAYVEDKKLRAKLMMRVKFTRDGLAKQQKDRMWPTPIMRVLAAAQNTTREINTREVHGLVHGFYLGDQTLIERFENNIAHFADQELAPKPTDKGGDTMVQKRYRDLVDRTCQFFRSSDSESNYDYSTPLIRMVQLLEHEDLFEITHEMFIQGVVTHAREIVPIYLSVSVCNMLTFTEGTIQRPATNAKLHYTVKFLPDLSRMPRWPDAKFY